MRLRCYIIDDEQYAIDILVEYIGLTPGLELIGTTTEPIEAITAITSGEIKADITFLDIEMEGIKGDKVAPILQPYTHIVFSTAHRHFAPDAFDLNAVDFLLKPFGYDRFLKAVTKMRERLAHKEEPKFIEPPIFYIQSEGKGNFIKIAECDIVYIESLGHYTKIHLDAKSYVTNISITELGGNLKSPYFLRVHKSFIVNLSKITALEGNVVHMGDKLNAVIGPSYRKAFFEKIGSNILKGKK